MWGLGAMGTGVAELLARRGYDLVGAISHQVGEPLHAVVDMAPNGVVIVGEPEEAAADADVCVIATHTRVEEVLPQILWAVARGMNVVTSAEEMFNAAVEQPAMAREIDAAARAGGVSVLGTGVNPGFIMDTLVVFLTTACQSVESISVKRVNDISPFGRVVVDSFGLGLAPGDFEKRVADGSVVGHVGFRGSIAMIGQICGLDIDEVVEQKLPIITEQRRSTPYGFDIEPGHVVGCNQIGEGKVDGVTVVRMEHPQEVHPEAGGRMTGDYIDITGSPSINLRVQPEVGGGAATIAVLANVIPQLLEAPSGLVTMRDLRLPTMVMRDGGAP
jgi:4-hydroxy-tetrahydrodipicolinate reductase